MAKIINEEEFLKLSLDDMKEYLIRLIDEEVPDDKLPELYEEIKEYYEEYKK